MLNDQYEPTSQNEEDILDALEAGGRLRAGHIAERTGNSTQLNNQYLRRLVASGWVHQPETGLYEINIIPRDLTLMERAQLYREYAERLEAKASE